MSEAVTRLHAPQDDTEVWMDRVRAAVSAETVDHGLSQKDASKGIGVSITTLNRWLHREYVGDNPAVTAKAETWLQTRAEARALTLSPARLDVHAELGLTDSVMAALAHAQAVGDVVLVHGRSGSGKSHALARYGATRAGVHLVTATAAVTSISGLYGRVCRALGIAGRYGSALAAEDAILERLEGRQALLAVDEAQYLGARLLDALRGLRDLSGCGLALVGDDTIRMTLSRCPQVMGRTGMYVGLGQPNQADVATLLSTVLERTPASAERKAARTAVSAPGGLHALRRLLASAFMIARADGRGAIAATDITAAVAGMET